MKRRLCDIFSPVEVLRWLHVSYLTLVTENKTAYANRRLAIFFPRRMHKEALWIQGGTILRALENVSPMEAWRLCMSTLFKIMSWGIINNSRWGGLYFLINISDRNICKCILDWQWIIIASKLPCALWLSDTGKYL